MHRVSAVLAASAVQIGARRKTKAIPVLVSELTLLAIRPESERRSLIAILTPTAGTLPIFMCRGLCFPHLEFRSSSRSADEFGGRDPFNRPGSQ